MAYRFRAIAQHEIKAEVLFMPSAYDFGLRDNFFGGFNGSRSIHRRLDILYLQDQSFICTATLQQLFSQLLIAP